MENPTGILLPAMALVGWTLAVLLLIPYQRFKATFAGQLTVDDFRLGESARVPERVSIPNRNFMNLLEVPVLFYVVCTVTYLTQKADPVAVALAWSYVALRVLHSGVHLTYNRVIHRVAMFAASNVVLIVLWSRLFLELAG
jgi:hypothetical protein